MDGEYKRTKDGRFTKGTAAHGRPKGTKNKVTALTQEVVSQALAEYQSSGLMATDFASLEPKDRLAIAEKWMQYCIPKMQAISADINVGASTRSIEEKLIELAAENEEII